jgi:hypothetical protein
MEDGEVYVRASLLGALEPATPKRSLSRLSSTSRSGAVAVIETVSVKSVLLPLDSHY